MDFDRKERAQSVASLLELLLAFEGLSRRASRAASDPRLTDGEIRLLINLLEKPSCQTELARALATDTGQINRTIGGLRRKLLVRAQPNSPRPKDEHLLVLTDLGGVWATSARIQ